MGIHRYPNQTRRSDKDPKRDKYIKYKGRSAKAEQTRLRSEVEIQGKVHEGFAQNFRQTALVQQYNHDYLTVLGLVINN